MFSPVGLAQNAEAAKDVASILGGSGMVMEPKYDGFRLLIHITANGVESYTRTGKAQKGKIPYIEAALAHLPPDTWLDGEIVAFDADGMPEWGKVQSCMGANVAKAAIRSVDLTYVAFDMLAYAGLDIRGLSLAERRAALEAGLGSMIDPDRVRVAPQQLATDAYHDEIVALGWEGTIVKDPTKRYASGARGHGWYKLKANDEMDVVIMGFKPGQNSFTGMIGAIEFGQVVTTVQHEQGDVVFAADKVLRPRGRCSGMNMAFRQELTDNQDKYVGQVISLAYMGIMPSGSPRHPQYKRIRTDKPAVECDWTL